MSLRKRAQQAHREQQAQDSSRMLSIFLRTVLGVESLRFHILNGPGGERIAVYIEDGLTFCAWKEQLRIIHERICEAYPARDEWTPVASLAELGAWLEKVEGPAEADPTGKAEAL